MIFEASQLYGFRAKGLHEQMNNEVIILFIFLYRNGTMEKEANA